jgi:hypothetical protein
MLSISPISPLLPPKPENKAPSQNSSKAPKQKSGDAPSPTNGANSSSPMVLAPLAHSPNKSKAPVPYFLWKNHKFPRTKKVTYANFICNIRPQKTETHYVRMAAGGDKLDYPSNASSPAVSMLDAKIHTNSTIYDASNGARYLGLDIKNFYLGTPMTYFQYIQVRPSVIPQEVWNDERVTTSPSPPTATSISKSSAVCTA